MPELHEVYSRLGSVEATLNAVNNRLDKIDDKLDTQAGMAADMTHMKNNISMMKQPVEDYKQIKERGLGMWTLFTFILGGATVAFNIISYIVRVWVLKIGG